MSLHSKLGPVQYREYDINLFLMIFHRMSMHSKLGPVQYREYDINLFLLFLMIFPAWASIASLFQSNTGNMTLISF